MRDLALLSSIFCGTTGLFAVLIALFANGDQNVLSGAGFSLFVIGVAAMYLLERMRT